MKTKIGQIWIETVLYTVIGLALIGLVLAFVMPKINETRDRVVVEQTLDSLNKLDEKMNLESGNVRNVDFTIKRGYLDINTSGDSLVFTINDVSKPYSEPNVTINFGRIELISQLEQKGSSIKMKLNYAGRLNITYKDKDNLSQRFTAASTPYRFLISNEGVENGIFRVNIEEISGG
jgi:hypothetical protein